jgi:DNA-directed RNA polymerase I subunit RPA1
MMITGKTLPSFIAYDPNPRASGFIADRFLALIELKSRI